MNPLLSIVIATKNRIPYCINCIETILEIKDEEIEVVVQDNSDTIELKEYIYNNINDKRLIYNYTPPPFSSIDNFNKVIDLANGEYLCMIGDDDGINPKIMEIIKYAKKNSLLSIASFNIGEFFWPNAIKKYKDGYLSIPKSTFKILKIEPEKRLKPLLLTGIVNYIPFNLPRIYHGIIKKEVLEKIKKKTGYYFGGLSPDIYSSIAFSIIIKEHTLIDYPISIAGTCIASTSAASVNGSHSGKLEDAPHFRSRGNYDWELEVPKYYSIQTIWAETAIKAFKEFNKGDLIKFFNLKFLTAQSFRYNKTIRKLIFQESKNIIHYQKKSFILFIIQVFILIIILKIAFTIKRFFQLLKKQTNYVFINGVNDINEATKLFENENNKNNISFKNKLI